MDILRARKKAAERKQSRKKIKPSLPDSAEESLEKQPHETATEPSGLDTVPAEPTVETHGLSDDDTVEKSTGDDAVEQKDVQIELLSFRLGGEAYALPVKDVKEVLKKRSLTSVPNAPPYILGVTSLRGMVLPVIDLCTRIGLLQGVRDEKSRIIVVNSEDEDIGLIVDRVTGVLRISPDAIQATPEHIEQGSAFLCGIVRKEDTLYILLDLKKTVGK